MNDVEQVRQQLRQERARQMREENEQRLEELEQQRREQEYLEEMGQDPLPERREWRLPEVEPPPRQRGRDTSPVNWSSVIDQRIAAERRFLIEVVGQAVGQLRDQIETNLRKEFEAELRALSVELCDVKIRCAELRIAHTELREQLSGGHITDLPMLPLRGHGVN